jgi:hypothetical protein
MIDDSRLGDRETVRSAELVLVCCALLALAATPLRAQHDPAEPPAGKLTAKLVARPARAIARAEVDQAGMRSLIEQLVACGTRHSLSSWDDPKRGIGYGRDHVVARLKEIAQASGGRLQIVVDKFDATSGRTNGKPVPFKNVYGVLPGSDPSLAKTVFTCDFTCKNFVLAVLTRT